MKRLHLVFVVIAVLGCAACVAAAGPDGDLYQLGIALNQHGIRGSWEQIGKEAEWKGVRAGAILKDKLYTAEADGSLRITNLEKGERTQVAKSEFGNAAFL